MAGDAGTKAFIESLKKLPPDFKAKGDLLVFVDECHRTQSGDLHKAMKALLPNAVFIGFTGTPLLKADKQKSIEVFGRYIHTYKFNEAVREGVVLDLRYEARDIDQTLTNTAKDRPVVRGQHQGPERSGQGPAQAEVGHHAARAVQQGPAGKIVADILMDMLPPSPA
jgi:type I restriction enzyme R subunit